MKIKHIIASLLLLLCFAPGAKADSYFRYPIVPDSINTLTGRCDYLADHFWDFCDLGKAFSARAKMAEEFKIYLSIIQNASAPVAESRLEAFMKRLDKMPKEQVYLAQVAEGAIYADTAARWVDQLYLPIARTVAANRRVDKASKARFAHQAEILGNSLVGNPAPSLPYTLRDGSNGNLQNDSANVVVIFFNDPDCSDCAMARVRLDADVSMTELINKGTVKMVSVALTEPDEKWRQNVASYPDKWVVAAAPDADLTFDLRGGTPTFYVLDRQHRIHFKHLNVDQVLDVARQLKGR